MSRSERPPGRRLDVDSKGGLVTTIDHERWPKIFPPPFAAVWGDDRFGLWAEIEVGSGGESVKVVQRLRWIEPGEFLMGSPVGEPGLAEAEEPQHLVRLTKGYWLADTACTQSLWLAVMGGNPSRFKGDGDRPVERVSWDDVQSFLRKLEQMIAGCGASLPTEAEWEYACRAGTITPFSFGEQITPALVNYDGNYPYADGERGLSWEQTVPAKSFPANQWGLHEMHGNVWEWCADAPRKYDTQPQVDPIGSIEGGDDAIRAIRGGSWFGGAGGARSAYRGGGPLGDRLAYLGFRFSLRSIEPSQISLPGGQEGL